RSSGLALPPAAAAAAGAVCISSSAVLMRLAGTSPSITALGRCAFALPVLGALAVAERRRGTRRLPSRSRWLARLAGVFLAGDLILWSHAIDAIGAGLGTVVTNLQVLIISLLAWLILGERPRSSLVLASPVMLAGLVLVGGLANVGGKRAYGTDPALGVAYGAAVAVIYAIYILTLRQATSPRAPGGTTPEVAAAAPRSAVAGVLFEATAGATATAAVVGFVLQDYRLGPAWPALGWLALLALTSQVIGWLLITVSMPRLAAGMIGALLLIQPAGSVALSYVFLAERPSALQLLGVVLVLAGVVVAVGGNAPQASRPGAAYSRRSTRIIRHAPAASTGESASKSP
ncbi:MAG TPA: DMT family transporter, partial [Streptosporangiaceae bacterium]|nr:DMT family transporter [Streptosporangiaceae bacterium]